MVITKENTQKSVESHLSMPQTTTLNKDATFKQIFGDAEEWIFDEGNFRFMLNPVNRRWLFWDRFHSSWEDTGHYAGEVKFVWDGNKLLTPKTSGAKADPAHEADVKMVAINGSAQEYPVLANTLIGSERNSDISIEDSESKALILQHAGGYTFFAIGKKDVILVNDNVIPQEGVLLHDGDRILIGKSEFDFTWTSQPDENETEKTKAASAPRPTKTPMAQITKLVCHNCHAELDENQKFCTSCGAKIIDKPVKPTCPGCGAEVSEGLKFCTNCGQKL